MNTDIEKYIYSYILKYKKDSDKIYDPNFHKDWQSRVFFGNNDEILRWAILKIEFHDGRVVYNYTDEEGVVCFPITKNHTWKIVKKNPKISEKELSILKHIEIIKEKDAEIYDPFIHKNWKYEKKNITGETYKNYIFKYQFNDDKIIYAYSDANGMGPTPIKEGAITSIKITKYIEDEGEDNSLSILAGILFFFIIIVGIFLISLSTKNNNSIESISKKAYNEYVKYNNILVNKLDSVKQANPFFYVYTNDFDTLTAVIQPNLKTYENPYSSSLPSYVNNQELADQYKSFLKDEKAKGYNVWLKTKEEIFNILNITTGDNKYKVAQSYYYTKKEKEQVTKLRNKDKRLNSIIKRRHVDSIQKESSVLSEKELLSSEFEHPLKALFAPRINLKNKTHKFYFTIFSKNATKKEIKEKLLLFEKMFLDGEKCSDCLIREIKINTQN